MLNPTKEQYEIIQSEIALIVLNAITKAIALTNIEMEIIKYAQGGAVNNSFNDNKLDDPSVITLFNNECILNKNDYSKIIESIKKSDEINIKLNIDGKKMFKAINKRIKYKGL